jgi:hypothetical protein
MTGLGRKRSWPTGGTIPEFSVRIQDTHDHLVSRPIFEPRTYRIQIQIVTPTLVCSVRIPDAGYRHLSTELIKVQGLLLPETEGAASPTCFTICLCICWCLHSWPWAGTISGYWYLGQLSPWFLTRCSPASLCNSAWNRLWWGLTFYHYTIIPLRAGIAQSV